MSLTARIASAVLGSLLMTSVCLGQFHDADPAAAEAFEEMIKSYRERPALKVTTTIAIEIVHDDMEASSSEVQAEFTFGKDEQALARVRGMDCYMSNNTMTVVHSENDKAYFAMPDDGSPYYAMMAMFMDLPYPHLAIFLGEQSMDDLYMQFHPKAPWVRPTSVATEQRDDREVQVLTLTSDFETIDVVIDPQTKLIQSMYLEVTGGHLVQPGMTMSYDHAFEYETFDQPLPDETFVFDPGEREKVDMLVQLLPEREGGGQRRGVIGGPVLDREAPPLLLATIDGDAIDIEDLRGQVVVIDFWATWCGPCVKALPLLHQVDRWARDEMLPVTVITVNTFEIPNPEDNTPDARLQQAREFWAKHRFTLPVAMDYTDEVAASYSVGGIPTTFVIRSDGVVHAQHVGAGASYVDDLKRDILAAIAALEDASP